MKFTTKRDTYGTNASNSQTTDDTPPEDLKRHPLYNITINHVLSQTRPGT